MVPSPLRAAVLLFALLTPCLGQQSSVEDLERRLEELERSTHARIAELEAQLEASRRAPAGPPAEAAPVTTAATPAATSPSLWETLQRAGERLFAGSGAARNEDPDPLGSLVPVGEDLQGNVYTSEAFRIRLGLSLRLHAQHNSTAVGENLSRALLPGEFPDSQEDAFRAFLSRSRLSFAAQGPTTLGGKTYAYLEMDFQRQTSDGEGGALSPSPRLRHAYVRWSLRDLFAEARGLEVTVGQTGSAWDLLPDTVDGNSMLSGLGAVHRRNVRAETALLWGLDETHSLVLGLGLERPFFGTDFIASDLGPGDLSGYPAMSVGLGWVTRQRLGAEGGLGVQRVALGARATYGQFEEDFSTTTFNPSVGVPPDLSGERFENVAVHGGARLQRIGFNAESRAGTFDLIVNGLWAQGDPLHLDAGFDRRTVLSSSGTRAKEARTLGGFTYVALWLLEDVSVRYGIGSQWALDSERVPLTGTFYSGDFVRRRSWQSEVSIWWTPGPLSMALSWNHTETLYRSVDPGSGGRSDTLGQNERVEFILWLSF
jgi:hypothetical protein